MERTLRRFSECKKLLAALRLGPHFRQDFQLLNRATPCHCLRVREMGSRELRVVPRSLRRTPTASHAGHGSPRTARHGLLSCLLLTERNACSFQYEPPLLLASSSGLHKRSHDSHFDPYLIGSAVAVFRNSGFGVISTPGSGLRASWPRWRRMRRAPK